MSGGRTGWKGLIHVRPSGAQHVLGPGAGGAYVCVVALAYDKTNFRELVGEEMDGLGLTVVEIDDFETFDPATVDWQNDEVQELIEELSDDSPIRYRSFFNYPVEDTDA